MLKNALITWHNRPYITFLFIFASVKQYYKVMEKKYFYHEFTLVRGRWQCILILDVVSSSDRASLVRSAKRNGYVYNRNSRCYIMCEHGFISGLISIRLNK